MDDVDPRFSLANERTYLAWIRTALALMAGGAAAAKALTFHHEAWRWIVAGPPIVVGAVLSADAVRRWRSYQRAMRSGHPLPVGRGMTLLALGLAVYGALVLAAVVLD